MDTLSEVKPVAVCPFWQRRKLAIFYCHGEIVEVEAPASLLNQIIKICDGQKTLEEVADLLSRSWDKISVIELLKSLAQNKILCNATSVGDYFWHFVINPTIFAHELKEKEVLRLVGKASKRNVAGAVGVSIPVKLTRLHYLMERRRSIRTFSSGAVDMNIISQMLWAGYGIVGSPHLVSEGSPQRVKVWQQYKFVRHTVPSAGALYPIRLSLILLRPAGEYDAGIYDVHFREHGTVELVLVKSDIFRVLRSFADQVICNNAQGIIVISGSFKLSGEKYGNRSLLYVPLEAGHIAQNIHLSAVEKGVGTLEIGGFLEEPMKHALRLPTSFWPLTTILFGHASETELENSYEIDRKIFDIKWAHPVNIPYELPFSMVFVNPRGKDFHSWACGRAKSPYIALSKAISEACEWSACGQIHSGLTQSSLKELDGAIDPRTIIRYHGQQYHAKRFPLRPFNEDLKYFWVEGANVLSGEKVYLLADCVYFPYSPQTPQYTFANSSGTAAHPDKEKAVQHAVLELVERDAFMIIWLNRLKMPRVSIKSLPGYTQKRIKQLQKTGFKVIVKDFTLDLAPVVFTFIQNEAAPATICAACSSFNILSAIDHALEEVEAAAYCWLENQEVRPINPQHVHHTYHHGELYRQREFFHQADFLAEGGKTVDFASVAKKAPKAWEELLAHSRMMEYQLFAVVLRHHADLRCESTEKLNIVKVFAPGMIPMSFGYGMEPCGMERIYSAPIRLGYRITPLRYNELTKFLHPYT